MLCELHALGSHPVLTWALLSVLLVWMIGHWFMNQEQHLGAKVLRWRLLGAALMLSAIVLVVT